MDGLRCYKLLFKPTPPFPQIDQTKIGRDLNFSMDSDSGDTFWVIIVGVIVFLLFTFYFFKAKVGSSIQKSNFKHLRQEFIQGWLVVVVVVVVIYVIIVFVLFIIT